MIELVRILKINGMSLKQNLVLFLFPQFIDSNEFNHFLSGFSFDYTS